MRGVQVRDGGTGMDSEQPHQVQGIAVAPGFIQDSVPGMTYLFVGHGQRAAAASTSSTGGVQALVVARDDECTDELRQGRKDIEDQHPPGVVISRASCSEVKPMPRLRRPDIITMGP